MWLLLVCPTIVRWRRVHVCVVYVYLVLRTEVVSIVHLLVSIVTLPIVWVRVRVGIGVTVGASMGIASPLIVVHCVHLIVHPVPFSLEFLLMFSAEPLSISIPFICLSPFPFSFIVNSLFFILLLSLSFFICFLLFLLLLLSQIVQNLITLLFLPFALLLSLFFLPLRLLLQLLLLSIIFFLCFLLLFV